MGVAGSAPGYTIAVTTAVLLATAGTLSPGALIIFAVPMLGIAVAYKALNARVVSAGAAYQWTTRRVRQVLGLLLRLGAAGGVDGVHGQRAACRSPPRRSTSSIRRWRTMWC